MIGIVPTSCAPGTLLSTLCTNPHSFSPTGEGTEVGRNWSEVAGLANGGERYGTLVGFHDPCS